jgi:transposase InsO family protein
MSAKEALIFDVRRGMSIAEAGQVHGVSRSCVYKWMDRVEAAGDLAAGLAERSRRPEHSPTRTSQELVDELLELKSRYEHFGPAKLVALLEERHQRRVMAVSTAGTILDRHGRVAKRKRRHASVGRTEHRPYEVAGAGDSMTTDFKGQIRMGNGKLCYPLTICDPFSRFVLNIVALPSTEMAPVKTAFDRVFREYGVPRQIISDNGTPFCSAQSLGGLTQLSRWWIEMGVIPVRIEPGRPDQNGVHERMHRTLAEWIALHPCFDLNANQRSYRTFEHEFNHVRPHQALGQKTPVSAFKPYRPYPKRTAIEYDSTVDVRKVNANGEVKWKGQLMFISEVLIGTHIGLLQVDEQLYAVHFGPVRIGFLNTATGRVMNRALKPTTTQ